MGDTGDILYSDQLVNWNRADDKLNYKQPELQHIPVMPRTMEILSKGEIYFKLTKAVEDPAMKTIAGIQAGKIPGKHSLIRHG